MKADQFPEKYWVSVGGLFFTQNSGDHTIIYNIFTYMKYLLVRRKVDRNRSTEICSRRHQ